MPAAISALRSGLVNQLNAITGLRTYEVIPDSPNFPAAVIALDRVLYDSTFARGCDSIEFTVTIVVGRGDDRTAQNRLETFIAGTGAGSVKTVIEADPTLGGVAMDARVTEANNVGTVNNADGSTFLFVDFQVVVTA
tara:strand:+ start:4946 stop:5356 length:411 start_codon:yes stop_codon:yes gene_type:complete